MKSLFATCITFLISLTLISQDFTQTVRGTVYDKQSQFPIPGAAIVVIGSNPIIGTTTDVNGQFELTGIPVGRTNLQVTFMGYSPSVLNNIAVNAGKEVVLSIELEERITSLKEAVVTADRELEKPLNEMATVSARTFSIEESQRFAGARNDVARMASNFAGVATSNDATNDIVIRGNSPNGLLWRLEGVDIPNPNHFGDGSASGGPVSLLNNNVLSNSDFMTGAFPAEYGNALSGVFDLRMRNGNNRNHEFMGQIGFNGIELGAEGPISKKQGSSYLINYRYSTLAFFDAVGLDIGTGAAVPQYQDLNVKLHFPTKKLGTFDLFGMGGISYIDFIKSDKDSTEVEDDFFTDKNRDIINENRMGVVGLSHKYFFNPTTYLKTTVSASASQNMNDVDSIVPKVRVPVDLYNQDFTRSRYALSMVLNKKINAQHNVRVGGFVTRIGFDLQDSVYESSQQDWRTLTLEDGNSYLYQPYVQWQYRVTDEITINPGLHASILAQTNEVSVEPRIGAKWQILPKHAFSAAYGLHSKIPTMDMLFSKERRSDGTYFYPNDDLEMTKSHHFVLGYDWSISSGLRLKAETYYQLIENAIVDAHGSSYSSLNEGSFFQERPDTLTNGGTGHNLGLELTLEQFLTNGYYYLVTASLFESKYKGNDDVERNTAFNGNYVLNVVGGKEWQILQKKQGRFKHSITFDGKVTYAGGNRYTPIDEVASEQNQETEYVDALAFSEQLPDYFRLDLRLGYKQIGKKITQEFAFDVQNVTNQQNVFSKVYDQDENRVKTIYQLGIFPIMQYRIYF
jgi:hypothetical protein